MFRATLLTGAMVAGLSLLTLAEDSSNKVSKAKSIEGSIVRASSIAGMAVKNFENKSLGKVEDVVIDMNTGNVRYAAISFGGFLGFGDKLFAVPFKAQKVQHESGSKSPYFVMNIDQKTLEQAKGFDKEHWPNFADPGF